MNDDVLVKVDNVSKRFCRSLKRSLWYGLQDLGSEIGGRRHGGGSGLPQSSADVQLRPDEFWALKDVSFELRRGECLGLIGRNGAGKTTLLRMLNGLIKPDTGRIEMKGNVGALIALGAGFNPILSGRENIYVSGSVFGLSTKDIDDKLNDIVEFAGIPDFIDSPVQTYSSGMSTRLGFSIATALQPDILLIDEVLAVGDIGFRVKCYNKLAEIRAKTATIIVSHSMHDIGRTATGCVLIRNGIATEKKGTGECIAEYNRLSSSRENLAYTSSNIDPPPPILTKPVEDCSIKELRWQSHKGGSLCCTIKLEVFSCTSIESVRIRMLIDDSSGEKLYEWSSSDHELERGLPTGRSIMSIELDRIFFSSGSYDLRLIIENKKNGDYLINYEPAFSFNINNGPTFGAKCRGRPNDVKITQFM